MALVPAVKGREGVIPDDGPDNGPAGEAGWSRG